MGRWASQVRRKEAKGSHVEELMMVLVQKQSQGRDNMIHFHSPLSTGTASSSSASTRPSSDDSTSTDPQPAPTATTVSTIPTITPLLPPPTILDSLPTNSLNFCKFALLEIPEALQLSEEVLERMYKRRRRPEGCEGLKKGKQGLLAVPNLMDSDSVSFCITPSSLHPVLRRKS